MSSFRQHETCSALPSIQTTRSFGGPSEASPPSSFSRAPRRRWSTPMSVFRGNYVYEENLRPSCDRETKPNPPEGETNVLERVDRPAPALHAGPKRVPRLGVDRRDHRARRY